MSFAWTLPSCLTSKQRAWIHVEAESRGWMHESHGDGSDRKITISTSEERDDGYGTDPCSLDGMYEEKIDDETLSRWFMERLGWNLAMDPFRNHSSKGLDLDTFVELQKELVEEEKMAEEIEAESIHRRLGPEGSQEAGKALGRLKCIRIDNGLLGKSLLVLGRMDEKILPEHKLVPHDEASLTTEREEPGTLAKGVVYRVTERHITLALEEVPDQCQETHLRIEKLANQVTYQRLQENLEELRKAGHEGSGVRPGSRLVPVFFGNKTPQHESKRILWKPMHQGLDASQLEAVQRALQARDLFLIHGPPGTGKTTTLVEYILQEVKRGKRILATASSNVAVDNLVERLVGANSKLKVLRVGHPARLLPSVLETCLDARVLASDNSALAKDCQDEMKAIRHKLIKLKPYQKAEAHGLKVELRRLRKEENKRQQLAICEVLGQSKVICATLTNVQSKHLKEQTFDIAVIDEAAQALEVACWGALLKASKVVLAGDHLQLPPTILSKRAEKRGLGRTLFERLHATHEKHCSSMLTMQYRMNMRIMKWSSTAMYRGLLVAHQSVANHTMNELMSSNQNAVTAPYPVLRVIDTAGCDMPEFCATEDDSKSNEGEARVVMMVVEDLIDRGVYPQSLGIITPYRAQVSVLRAMKPEHLSGLEISTVDGFQGREKEAIILSLVRSNDAGEVGFLSDRRRMNVAITRARRHCTIVGDSDTVTKDPFLATLWEYFEEHGEVRSAEEVLSCGI